ncbi:MAG: hypothetical protein ACYS8K_08095, partial [Planctomycetota bacterium]
MALYRKPARLALIVALCLLSRVALGQGTASPEEVRAALNALRAAPSDEVVQKRAAVVQMGELAIEPLVEAVQQRQGIADDIFVGQCIIALGELKAREATQALIDALESNDLQIAYLAASALGTIWEGKGATDEGARQVNGALLALMHSDVPPATFYGPGLALIKVNSI